MKATFYKAARSALWIMVCLSICIYTAWAHPLTQRYALYDQEEVEFDYFGQIRTHYYVGSETNGWRVDENYHSRNKGPIQFRISSELNGISSIRNAIINGAAKWEPCGKLEVTTNPNIPNLIRGENISDLGGATIACLYLGESEVDSEGHYQYWTMQINTGRENWQNTTTASTIAHEFGHVFGLVDLRNSNNTNKIMYYQESGCTASGPTGVDGSGVLVATGQHTNHRTNGGYVQTSPNTPSHCSKCFDCFAKYYPVSSCRWNNQCTKSDVGYHYRYCRDCGGRSIQYCNYVGNTCVICGGR